jgi:hypothetical protein
MQPVAQVAVIAAIVASMLYIPAAALLALFSHFSGVSLYAFMTFRGALNMFFGLLVWWLLAFAGASVYAAFVFPWKEKVLAWPRKN